MPTMDLDKLFRRAGVDKERDERAQAAVKAFRALQPSLSAYARMLTKRRDVLVEMAARDNGSTDGKRIFYRPPIALGDRTEHVRTLCDKRDDVLQQLCAACAIREEVLVVIYHEIAHICFDSFQITTDKDRREMIQAAIAENGGKYAEAIARRIEAAPEYTKSSYIGMAGLVSPFLPFLVNALEDARVNRKLHEARKGTKKMFDASTQKIFREGVEQKDASGKIVVIPWSEYPQNMQVTIGVYCIASGYNFTGWFIPPVEEALHDEELNNLVSQMDTIRTAAGVYHLSFPILARLRELGFCKAESDPEPEPEPEPVPGLEPEPQEEQEDDGEEGEGGDSSPSNEGADSSDDHGESEEQSDDSVSESGGSTDSGDTESELSGPSDVDDRDDSVGDDSFSDGESSDEDSSDSSADSGHSDSPRDGSTGPEDSRGEGSEPEEGKPEKESTSASDEGDRDGGDESDVIDTGADEGRGGVEIIEDESWDDVPMGEPGEVAKALEVFGHHDEPPKSVAEQKREESEEAAMDRAIIQGIYFETPSRHVNGVKEHRYGIDEGGGWDSRGLIYTGYSRVSLGIEGDFTPPESILGPALLQMRVTFADNARGKEERNRKSGKINPRVLGKRAHFDDPRLFQKRTIPGKKKYFVLIGIDISGSTVGQNIALAKRAAYAQAELCARMGIDFAIYAHSANYNYGTRSAGIEMDIYLIKEAHEPWDATTQKRLHEIGPDSANLDGHALEYFRKRLDEVVDATDRIILYYSDGKMPAENHDEELQILQREIRTCKQKGYVLLGVGIRTDSPSRHGLPTVQVNTDDDIVKVVLHLEKALLAI